MELGGDGQAKKTSLLIPRRQALFRPPAHNPVMLKPLLLTVFLTKDNVTFAVMTRLPFVQQRARSSTALPMPPASHVLLATCLT